MVQGRCSVHMVDYAQDKPFRCQHPNCFYAYKNVNGLKYHEEHVHQASEHRDKKAKGNTATHRGANLASSSTADASVPLPSKRTIDPSNLIKSLQGLHPDFLALLLENPPPPSLTSNVIKRSANPKTSSYPFPR
ncbi:putative transcriptional regulator of ribosomal protein biogenesis [Entomophthora muscae]|uniref:Transcriptional regulator of ribosomal protein biogenesis n=1 Tax=Entomophthora muscae TaxID=34485 RepID=A0ACC2TYT9_9FUNG|nr:putative transcriptional regulator of ribosomal protein biogenesis [Entomophthora muscae]